MIVPLMMPRKVALAIGAGNDRLQPQRRAQRRKVCAAMAIRAAVVSQQSAPKIQANQAKRSGNRQLATNSTMVSLPSVRPPPQSSDLVPRDEGVATCVGATAAKARQDR